MNFDQVILALEEIRAEFSDTGGETGEDNAGIIENAIETLKAARADRFKKYGYGIKPDSSYGGVNGPVGGNRTTGISGGDRNSTVVVSRQPVGANKTNVSGKIVKSEKLSSEKKIDELVADSKLSPGAKVREWVKIVTSDIMGEITTGG